MKMSKSKTVGIVVWGTAAMRTAGDDAGEILALLGVRPVWNPETRRVVGLEAISLEELGRPRVDVTVRISGFFRDAFPHLVILIDDAIARVAALDEPDADNFVAAHARERGVILADTKFEFGLDADGVLTLGDEVCTPDSSRFWPADSYEVGRGQPSFDKQYVRDWASGTGWDKTPPAPAIPDDVVEQTRERYVTAYERLSGEPFSAWLERTAP